MEKDNKKITQEEILQFYSIIQFSEKDLKENAGGFVMDKGRIQKFKEENQLIIKTSKTISKHEDRNKFIFTKNRKSQGASFIAHVRNAYSHSNITIDGDYYLIEDYKTEKKKVKIMTAYGRIHRNLLFPFIDCMMKDREDNLKIPEEK